MTSRFVVLCAFLEVSSIVASSVSAPGYNVNSGGSLNVKESEEREDERTSHDVLEDGGKKIDDSKNSGNLYESRRNQSEVSDVPWFEKVPLLPVAYARSSTMPEGPCKKQAQRYLRDLKNGTLWAIQMYDASTKYPDGLISGRQAHFGDFDGCYNLEAKLAHSVDDDLGIIEEISGRYCLVEIQYQKEGLPPIDPERRFDTDFDPNGSVWEAIREKGNEIRKARYVFRVALCVPEVCSRSDIEAALQEPLKSFGAEQKLKINVTVKSYFSQARKEAREFSRGAKIYCSIVAGLIGLVMIGTWYDFSLKDDEDDAASNARNLVLCFSARRTFNDMMQIPSSHPGLASLHRLRVDFIIFIILGHRSIQYWVGPVINTNYLEMLYGYRFFVQLLGMTVINEGLFAIGGLLLSHSLLTELDAKKKMYFFEKMFIRFVRLSPSYMMIVFFHALILPHMGSGPLWEWKVGMEQAYCEDNWWTNLLFVNNFCMFQSWYSAVDYQLYALALIGIYLFWRMPRKYGYAFMCAIIIGATIAPVLYSHDYDAPTVNILDFSLEDVREHNFFTQYNCQLQSHIAPYFIGVVVGAVVYDHGQARWQLGKISSNILFILLVPVLSIGSQYLGYKYYKPNANPPPLESALYAALSKAAFAIATSAVPLLITVGTGLTFHCKLWTPRWYQPLARLTYGAYLVHGAIQLYALASMRVPNTATIHNALWEGVSDIMFTVPASLFLVLIVEGPFRALGKRLIIRRATSLKYKSVKKEAKKIN